jgi:hypothetical protein
VCGADTLPVYSTMPAADRPPTRLFRFRFRSTGAHSLPLPGGGPYIAAPQSCQAALLCGAVSDGRGGGSKKGGWLEWRFSFGLKNQTRGVRKEPFLLRETY